MNSYFGYAVRNCPIEARDIEMLLLKLTLKSALLSGSALSYEGRIFLSLNGTKDFIIVRMSEPTNGIIISGNRPAEAIDRFVLAFIYEEGSNIDKIQIYKSTSIDDVSVTWGYLKKTLPGISVLLSEKTLIPLVFNSDTSN